MGFLDFLGDLINGPDGDADETTSDDYSEDSNADSGTVTWGQA